MHTPTQYRLLHDLPIPGSYAVALRAGDQITEQQRATANLVVGQDVEALTTDAMTRPADDAERAAWQDYAVVRGVPYHEAVNMDRKQLLAAVDKAPAERPLIGAERPDIGARKSDWVDYAAAQMVDAGMDAPTAVDRASDATKAELVEAFGPDATPEARQSFLTPDGTPPAED